MTKSTNDSALNQLKDYYYLSVFVCFTGVLGFYSAYAYL